MVYYHLTPIRNVPAILRDGLQSRSRAGEFAYDEPRVYLWTELDSRAIDSVIGQMFDEHGFEPYVMLRVECDCETVRDECMAGNLAVYTTEAIPAECVCVMGDALDYA
jgi:hypothetical protein